MAFEFRRRFRSSVTAGMTAVSIGLAVGGNGARAMEASSTNNSTNDSILQTFEQKLEDAGKQCFTVMKEAGLDLKKFDQILVSLNQLDQNGLPRLLDIINNESNKESECKKITRDINKMNQAEVEYFVKDISIENYKGADKDDNLEKLVERIGVIKKRVKAGLTFEGIESFLEFAVSDARLHDRNVAQRIDDDFIFEDDPRFQTFQQPGCSIM